jgi:hypothetical protein
MRMCHPGRPLDELGAPLEQKLPEGRGDGREPFRAQVYHVPVAHDRQPGGVELRELAGRELEADGVHRDEADPEARDHRLLDRLVAAHLHARAAAHAALAGPITSTSDEFAAYLRSEIDKWAKVATAAGMKID